MDINTSKLNQDVHRAQMDQKEVHRLVAEKMADQLGVSLKWPHVTWSASTRQRDISTGFFHDVHVEIIVDHSKAPQAERDQWAPLGRVYQEEDGKTTDAQAQAADDQVQ